MKQKINNIGVVLPDNHMTSYNTPHKTPQEQIDYLVYKYNDYEFAMNDRETFLALEDLKNQIDYISKTFDVRIPELKIYDISEFEK